MVNFYVGMLATLVTASAFAGNPEYAEFAVTQAHKQGYMGCDTAIRRVHQHASGEQIRINVRRNNVDPSILTMESVWGSNGDSLFSKTTFVEQGEECYYENTVILTTNKTCLAYTQDVPTFKIDAVVADYMWMKNEGGVTLLLQPSGERCVITFSVDQRA